MRDVEFTARVRQPVLTLLVTSRNVIPNRDQRKFGLSKGQPSTVREHQRFVFDSLDKRDVWYVVQIPAPPSTGTAFPGM